MNTRNKQHRWLLHLLGAAILLLGLAACGSSEGSVDEKEPEKPKPEVPVADGDWQVVPVTGGTITKDSISITFPSGTFSEETKVAITEVKKGEVLGGDEVSKFYQLTMPTLVKKSFVVNLKCDVREDGVNMVAHVPVFRISEDKFTSSEIILPAKYLNGEYIATIPSSSENNESNENLSFSIGVGHLEYWGMKANASKTRGNDAISQFGEKFTEGDISWHFNITGNQIIHYGESLNNNFEEINEIIREAIKKIHKLGFKMTKRDVGVSFREIDQDGVHEQSPWKNEWSTIVFNTRYLTNFKSKLDAFRRSAIHEFMHDYQADYDERSTKWFFNKENDRVLLYESGAVWAEQFMGGSFPLEFARGYINQFIRGFDNPIEITEKRNLVEEKKLKAFGKYSNHGYGMSSLLQYLTKACTDYNMNDNNLVELYKKWGSNSTKETLQAWTKGKGYDIMYTNHYDEFLMSLLSGELIPGYNVNEASETYTVTKKIDYTNTKQEISGECYPLGCETCRFTCDFAGKDLSGKKLVIKQHNKGVKSYALTLGGGSKEYERWGYRTVIDDSLVITGEELEKLYYVNNQANNRTKFFLYIVNTPDIGSAVFPWEVSVELQGVEEQKGKPSVDPDNLNYKWEGESQDVVIKKGGYKYCGADVPKEYEKWISVVAKDDSTMAIAVQPNLSFEDRKGKVECWVSSKANPTDAEKKILPVEITQAPVTGVDWDPKELKFTASGGSEKISFKFGEFTRFGAQVRKEGHGWCGVAAANGKLTITVQPNESKDSRECIVDAYVTNSQNPTDEDKLLMPITVYQEGAKETKPSSLKIKSVVFSAEYNDGSKRSFMVDWNKKEGTIQAEIINGSTRVTCTNNTGYNKSTLSFDIDNESLLTSKKATFSNFKTEGKEYVMGRIANEWNIATKSTSDYSYYTDLTGGKTCSLHWKQGEFAKFEHSQSSNSITLSDSRLSELEATVSIFFEEPPQ